VAWVDRREERTYIYFSRSFDGGETFSPGIRIDSTIQRQDRPFLLFDSDGNPLIAWIKTYYDAPRMNPVGYIYVTKSIDGGITFLPSVCVYCNSLPFQGWPSLSIDSNNNPMVVTHYYNDKKNRWNVYFVKSIDNILSFSLPVLVEDGLNDQVASGKNVLVVDSNDNPYIALTDNRSGYSNVRLARSSDGGLSFLPSVAIDSYPTNQVTPSLGIDSEGIIYIVWSDERNDYQNIYFSMSEDGGLTFRQSASFDQGRFLQNRPSISVDFDHDIPHITWTDKRKGICYLYYTKSMDKGASFLPPTPVYPYPIDRGPEVEIE
jgi:hypothetical protein